MWEGLKFNLTKLFNHLLVDNVGHLLLNRLIDLHVSLLGQYHYHHRQPYDHLYDHHHIIINELNLHCPP